MTGMPKRIYTGNFRRESLVNTSKRISLNKFKSEQTRLNTKINAELVTDYLCSITFII